MVKCPKCGSSQIVKYGHTPVWRGSRKIYLCKDCSVSAKKAKIFNSSQTVPITRLEKNNLTP